MSRVQSLEQTPPQTAYADEVKNTDAAHKTALQEVAGGVVLCRCR